MAVLATAVLLGLAVAAAAHLLLGAWRRWRHFCALEKALPGPASLPLLGHLMLALGITPDNLLTRFTQILGDGNDLVRITPPNFLWWRQLCVFVRDPDHLQELFRRKDMMAKASLFYHTIEPIGKGLLSVNGDQWRTHRRTILPAFHPSILDRFVPVFADEARRFVDRLRCGVEQEVHDALLEMVARSFFRTSLTEKLDADAECTLVDMQAFVKVVFGTAIFRCTQPWLWPDAMFALTAAGQQIQHLRTKVEAYCRWLMATRHAELTRQKDAGADSIGDRHRTLLDTLVDPEDGKALPDEEALNELTMFLGTATDTTSTALNWAIKTLSLRPDVQERLRQEATDVLGDNVDGPITAGDLSKLEYTECVLKETMRLLPVVPLIARQVKDETTFCGYTLPASTWLCVFSLNTHRDPRHWPDPLRFDPDRFLPENSVGRHPYAYMPFSLGPRNCIGSRYAMMVMKTLLATLSRRYRIDPANDGYKEPADFPMTTGATSRMIGPMRVKFTKR